MAYFDDGVSEDIISMLLLWPGITVVARNLSSVYKVGLLAQAAL